MRKCFLIMLFFFCTSSLSAQSRRVDSLKGILASAIDNSTKLALLNQLFYAYVFSYPDSSLTYVEQEIVLAKQIQSDLALCHAYADYTMFFDIIGEYPQSLHYCQEELRLAEKTGSFLAVSRAYIDISGIEYDEGNYDSTISYSKRSKFLIESN